MNINFREPSNIYKAAIDIDNFRDRDCNYNLRGIEVRFISKSSGDNLSKWLNFNIRIREGGELKYLPG